MDATAYIANAQPAGSHCCVIQAVETVQFKQLNNNVILFGGTIGGELARQDPPQAAARRRATANELQDNGQHPVMLAKTPRTLAELWEEYQFGIGGKKAAKDFISQDSGNRTHGIKQKN